MLNRRFALATLAVLTAQCRPAGPPSVLAPRRLAVTEVSPAFSAAATASGLPIEVLREETRYRLHANGTKVQTQHLKIRVLSLRGIEDWAQISAVYRPWFEAKPELSATVTTPDGRTHTLDPLTIAETPVERDDGLLSDARRVVAPLPAIVKGAVVSQTIVTREKRPFFEAGTVGRFYFGMGVPVRSSRLVIEAPKGVALKYEVRGLTLEPSVRRDGDLEVTTFSAGPLMPHGRPVRFLPFETPRFPYVAFSTARSWSDVARRYHQLIEAQLEGFDAGVLLRGIDRGLPRPKLVAALVARLHETVRYTAVEFGQKSIVPWKPSVTLARRFGDCKDKAALLIAMLRAAGLDGAVALVRSGFGEDVRPSLPGLEPFDHVVVRVEGTPALWVDATAPYVPVGELPSSVQGRWALLAQPKVDGLRRLPEAAPKANRYLESRTVTLAEWGPVDVVERTLTFGAMARRLRGRFADSSADEVRASLEKYVRSSYKASALVSHQMSDPKDLETPFEIEVQARDASIGYTSSTEAAVRLTNAVLFSWLPPTVRQAALSLGGKDQDPERRRARRHVDRRETDFIWPETYVAELSFIVRPPAGYALRALPEPRRVRLGPGYFEERYRRRDDGAVGADFALDIGRRRYSADDLRAFVEGLEKLWKERVPKLAFDHQGAVLLGQGKLKDGIAYYRRLATQSPKHALHQARLAEALLRVELGGAARSFAEKAVELQPDSPYARYTQAWVLQHDVFGRAFKPGFDRDGAVAAYERALGLNPDNDRARKNLAEVLEYDRRGRHYADRAGVEAAIGHYRRLVKRESPDEEVERQLLMALFRTDRCAELSVLARDARRSLARDSLEVSCAILLRGLPDGLRTLEQMRLPPAARQSILEATLRFLVTARAYDVAKEVALMAIPGASDPVVVESQIRTLDRLKRYEQVRLDDGKPARVVQRLYEAMFDARGQVDSLSRFFAQESLRTPHAVAVKLSLKRELSALSLVQDGEMPHSILRDSVLSLTRFESEGDDATGYRISSRVEGGTPNDAVWFVVKKPDGYRIRAGRASAWLIGLEALALLDRGKHAAAARWLTWARDIWPVADDDVPSAVRPFTKAWPTAQPARMPTARIRAAAALLAALGPGDLTVLKALGRARRGAGRGLSPSFDHAAFLQYDELGDDKGRLRTASRLRTKARPLGAQLWARALVEAGRYDDAEKAIKAAKDTTPALRAEQLADVAVRRGDFSTASRLLESVAGDSEAARERTLNNLAWWSLFSGRLTDAHLGWALRANSLSRFKNPSQIHTLAALYAETGRPREALKLLQTRLDLLGRAKPANADWYVIGRVYEHFELYELAREAYGKVVVEPHERLADSTHALAQRKLRALGPRGRARQI